MSALTLAVVIVLLAAVAFYLGRSQSLNAVSGNIRNLHSLPGYYGLYSAIWCALPALFSGTIVETLVKGALPGSLAGLPEDRMSLFMTDVRNTVSGNIVSNSSPEVLAAAEHYRSLQSISTWALTVIGLALAIAGLWLARQRIVPHLKSRELVERLVMITMIAASSIA
ncbi:MAG: phosphate ABC transporter permease family protein, partial [Proteobacteria bacterium]|nr:phosphate ABC transporter permease family protein [Pseudomonadota bacterium]